MKEKITAVLGMLLVCGMAHGATIPLDLNDFWSDPEVTITADGSSASFVESPLLNAVILSNDPYLGDPEVILAGLGVWLEFDYDFSEGVGGDDEFGAWLIDPDTGWGLGEPYELFMQESGSGTASFDLSALNGMSGLGFQFQLSALFGDADYSSTLEISNMRLVSAPVPEPATIALLGMGLTLLAARRRRQTAE